MTERRGAAPKRISATIVGPGADDRVLIRLADGREVMLPAPGLRGLFDAGDGVVVLLEGDDEIAGWMLPDRNNLGVNMRGMGGDDG